MRRKCLITSFCRWFTVHERKTTWAGRKPGDHRPKFNKKTGWKTVSPNCPEKYCHYSAGFTWWKTLNNFVTSFGGIFAPQRNKFRSKKQKAEESMHGDLRAPAGASLSSVHPSGHTGFKLKQKHKCLVCKQKYQNLRDSIYCSPRKTNFRRSSKGNHLAALMLRQNLGRNNPHLLLFTKWIFCLAVTQGGKRH